VAAAAHDGHGGGATWLDPAVPRPDFVVPPSPARLRSLSLDVLSRALTTSGLHAFTQAELSAATRGLSSSNFIGEGGFGPVYKGFLDERLRPGEIEPLHVAVKYLDADGPQGRREWLVPRCLGYGLDLSAALWSSARWRTMAYSDSFWVVLQRRGARGSAAGVPAVGQCVLCVCVQGPTAARLRGLTAGLLAAGLRVRERLPAFSSGRQNAVWSTRRHRHRQLHG